MHEPVRSHVEDYIARPEWMPAEAKAHLKECDECRAELDAMALQARAIRALRAGNVPDQRAGFYARVMERIEAQRPMSIWSVFLESTFGPRLALASAAATVIMGFFLVQGEPLTRPKPMPIDPPSVAMVTDDSSDRAFDTGIDNDDDQMRSAVFASLASYRQ